MTGDGKAVSGSDCESAGNARMADVRCARGLVGPRLVLLLAAAAMPAAVHADYPERPIRLLVGQTAGGGNDIGARLIARKLSDAFGQSIIVDNRPGAAGLIAGETAARAAPDGYTLYLGTINDTTSVSVRRKLPYDLIKDFAPITLAISSPYLVGVYPGLPAQSLQELIALAKAKPRSLTYASTGVGGSSHLSTELLKSMAGMDMVHVPYKGTAPALGDLFSGQIQLHLTTMTSFMPHVRAGRVRALAVTSAARSPVLPQVPTVMESGVPRYEAGSWNGILAPSRTPPAVIQRLNRELVRALDAADVRETFGRDGSMTRGGTPEEFARYIKDEIAKWAAVVKTAGIVAE